MAISKNYSHPGSFAGRRFKGAGSRVRPRDNVVVLKLVDGVNPPQQLNLYLVGNCIAAHREDLTDTKDNNFASPNTLRFIKSIF